MHQSKNVDEHIASFPVPVRERLEKLRAVIQKAAPAAEETIGYGIPTYKSDGNLVHFAGYKNHIGFYPGSSGVLNFKKELSAYVTSKGAIQFPHDRPIPFPLIKQIVQFRVLENKEKAASKKKPTAKAVSKTKNKDSDAEQVKQWINALPAADKKEIEALRKIIKAASPVLKERIKWNAPSYYTSADLLTFGPYKNKTLLLVFHHPAIVKIKSSLMEGNYKDRRLVKFASAAAAKKEQKELSRVIEELVILSSKK